MGMDKKAAKWRLEGFNEACEMFDLILKNTPGVGPKTIAKIQESLKGYAEVHIMKKAGVPFNVMR